MQHRRCYWIVSSAAQWIAENVDTLSTLSTQWREIGRVPLRWWFHFIFPGAPSCQVIKLLFIVTCFIMYIPMKWKEDQNPKSMRSPCSCYGPNARAIENKNGKMSQWQGGQESLSLSFLCFPVDAAASAGGRFYSDFSGSEANQPPFSKLANYFSTHVRSVKSFSQLYYCVFRCALGLCSGAT